MCLMKANTFDLIDVDAHWQYPVQTIWEKERWLVNYIIFPSFPRFVSQTQRMKNVFPLTRNKFYLTTFC